MINEYILNFNNLFRLQYLRIPLFFFLFCFVFQTCKPSANTAQKDTLYKKEIKQWRSERLTTLTSGHSWLSLAGLYRLKEGRNSFGSSSSNTIIFPEQAAPEIGSIYLTSDSVMLTVNAEADVYLKEHIVSFCSMKSDTSYEHPLFRHRSFFFHLIERGGQSLIRLRDTINPAIQNFTQLDQFPIDQSWSLKATFKPYSSPKIKTLKNILGMEIENKIDGVLEFKIDGQFYELEVLDGGPEDYFLIFSDETTGNTTYGGGRYLYAPRPKEGNFTSIDFNKAHNPPCAFTDYATCLIPDKNNHIPLAITAGEKTYGKH